MPPPKAKLLIKNIVILDFLSSDDFTSRNIARTIGEQFHVNEETKIQISIGTMNQVPVLIVYLSEIRIIFIFHEIER